MPSIKELLETEAVQDIIEGGQKVLFELLLDLLEKLVNQTSTPEDNKALARFLRIAADRVEETTEPQPE